jgi:hypothetical protein
VPRRASSLSKQEAQLEEEQLGSPCRVSYSDWPVNHSKSPGKRTGAIPAGPHGNPRKRCFSFPRNCCTQIMSTFELPPGKPHSAATRPQPACARSRLWPHLTPSVPETAFSNGATQETYSVSIPIGLATAIIDRAQMPDQAYPRNDDTFRSGFYPWEAAAAKRVSGRCNFEANVSRVRLPYTLSTCGRYRLARKKEILVELQDSHSLSNSKGRPEV